METITLFGFDIKCIYDSLNHQQSLENIRIKELINILKEAVSFEFNDIEFSEKCYNKFQLRIKDVKEIISLIDKNRFRETIHRLKGEILFHFFPFRETYYLWDIYYNGCFLSPQIYIHEKEVLENSYLFKCVNHIDYCWKSYLFENGQEVNMKIRNVDIYHLTISGKNKIKSMLKKTFS